MKCFAVLLATLAVALAIHVPETSKGIPTAVVELTKSLDDVNNAIQGAVLGRINQLLQRIPHLLDIPMSRIGPVIAGIHGPVIGQLQPVFQVVPDLKPAIDGIFNTLGDLLQAIAEDADDETLSALLENIVSAVNDLTTTVVDAINNLYSSGLPISPEVGVGLAAILFGYYGSVLEILSSVQSTLTGLSEPIQHILDTIVDEITDVVNDSTDLLNEIVRDKASKINPIENLLDGLEVLGVDVQGILDAFDE